VKWDNGSVPIGWKLNVANINPQEDPADLELSPTQIQAMGHAVVDRVSAHIASLAEMPSIGDYDGIEDLCRNMREGPPEQGSR